MGQPKQRFMRPVVKSTTLGRAIRKLVIPETEIVALCRLGVEEGIRQTIMANPKLASPSCPIPFELPNDAEIQEAAERVKLALEVSAATGAPLAAKPRRPPRTLLYGPDGNTPAAVADDEC